MQTSPPFVRPAVGSFPNESAWGPDGSRPQHIKDLLAESNSNESLLENITEFVIIILEGKTPLRVHPILFGGSLKALRTVGGGLHLIAVGYYWRRLVGKVACRQISSDCADILAPKQLGFGVQGGAEIGVHATRRFLENMIPGQVFIKIDFKNAFNNIWRNSMLEAVKNHFLQLLPFVLSSYSESSELRFGPHTISSEEVAQQGDPLGLLLFCLTVYDMIASLKSEMTIAYLDDVGLGDDAGIEANDFQIFEEMGAQIGLKCES